MFVDVGSFICNILGSIQELLADEKYYFLCSFVKDVIVFGEYLSI